jgi:hypothetical protein
MSDASGVYGAAEQLGRSVASPRVIRYLGDGDSSRRTKVPASYFHALRLLK